MENDLRYPEELISGKYEELEISQQPAGRGSMPGSPYEELEEKDNLISGRGCVP